MWSQCTHKFIIKETGIKIRISDELKTKFKNKCESENSSMSNKINQFIHDFVFDMVTIEPSKSIRILLVKSILTKELLDNSFEYSENLKENIEKVLKENLRFDVKIINEVMENGWFKGDAYFKLEDGSYYNISFTVIPTGNVKSL